MNKSLYIFDLDGTLADIRHREHFLAQQPKNWDAFYAACPKDPPIKETIKTLQHLVDAGAEIRIWTGRGDQELEPTKTWLAKHGVEYTELRMRPSADRKRDDHLKEEWLGSLPTEDARRLVGTFEDRQRVVDMWRRNGVTCYQVAEGNY